MAFTMTDELFLRAAEVVSAAGYGNNHLLWVGLGIGYINGKQVIQALQDEGILARVWDYNMSHYALLRPIGFY